MKKGLLFALVLLLPLMGSGLLAQTVCSTPVTGCLVSVAGGGGAPSFPLLAPNGTAQYSFASCPTCGLAWDGTSMYLYVSNVPMLRATNGVSVTLTNGSGLDVLSATPTNFTVIGATVAAPTTSQVAASGNNSASGTGANLSVQGGGGGAPNGSGGDVLLAGGGKQGTGLVGRVLVGSTTWLQQAASRPRLTVDYTNVTASFSNTVLSIPVVSGRAYSFTLSAFFSDSTAADGAQFDFNGGSATSTNFRAHCVATNNVGAGLVLTNAATTSIATAVQVTLALTTQTWLQCSGTFEPSSTGTFIVRAAQTAHTAGTLTVNRGSYLWAEDMP